MHYDIPLPISLEAPEGTTIILANESEDVVLHTELQAIPDVLAYLSGVGDMDGRGLGGIFFMTADGHVWDYWKNNFVASAVAAAVCGFLGSL